MFKENDNMRPGPTPERVLAVCRLISQGSYTNQDIYKECALNEDADLNDEAIRSSIDSAEELGFINRCEVFGYCPRVSEAGFFCCVQE